MKKLFRLMRSGQNNDHLRKIWLTMKLTLVLFFLAISQMMASEAYSQVTKVSLHMKDAAVKEVLNSIEQNSEFVFLYNSKLVNVDRKVSIDYDSQKIASILDDLFQETDVVYTVVDRQIVLTNKADQTSFAAFGSQQGTKTVNGTVRDGSGLPIPGVTVLVKGTTIGIVTDSDGKYSVKLPANAASLVFSFVGMRSQEVKIGSQTKVDVVLADETIGLEEVVAIAYGTVKKKDLTGAITTIDSKLISVQSTSSATQALEGTVAGLQVSAIDGQPGLDMGIRVRGVGSANLNSSGALVVIDGVPAQIDNPLSTINSSDIANITVLKDAASTALYGSRGANGVVLVTTKKGQTGKTNISFSARCGVTSVGPYKLGTIDNSKDYYEFAWKSIYNSYRYGMNGTGTPQNWTTKVKNPNYSDADAAKFASEHLFNYTNSETTWGRNNLGNYMAYSVPGAVYESDGVAGNANTSAKMTGAYLVGFDGKLNPQAKLLYNDNYGNVLLETNVRQEYNMSANGGNDKVDYFVSIGYLEDPSYISNSKFNRYSGRSNVNAKLTDWLKVGTNISFARTLTNAMGTSYGRNPGSNQGNVFRFINGTAPIVPVYAYNQDGSYRTNTDGTIYNSIAGSTYSPLGLTPANYGGTNIVYSMKHDIRQEVADVLGTRTYAEISFLKDFKFLVNFSLDKDNWTQTRYMNSVTGIGKGTGGMFKLMYNMTILNTQELLSYNKDINKHHVDAMVAHEYNDWKKESVQYGSAYELVPGFLSSANFVSRYVNVGSMMGVPGYGLDIVRMESYLGRANYVYDEKYYLTGSLRGDGSSKFKNNRWGNFWSVGGGWRLSSEGFMAGTKYWLDNLKVRASYGIIGNSAAIGNYSGYRTWGYGTKYTTQAGGTGVPILGSAILTPGAFVNDALTWENTKTFDVGIDFTFFKRFYGTFDFYNRVTDNTFYNQPVNMMAVGQDYVQSNNAVLRNRGVELELGGDIISTKDFTWNVSLNGAHYTTVLVDVPDGSIPKTTPGLPEYTYEANGEGWLAAGAGNVSNGQYYLRGEGRNWYNLWMYKYAGVDQNTGLPQYYHTASAADVAAGTYAGAKEGDVVKTNNYNLATKYEVGDATPKVIGGFSTTVKYKGFDFTAVTAYQLGGKYYSVEYGNGLLLSSTNLYYGYSLSNKLIGNTWTPENTNAKYPMQWYGANGYDGATWGSWKYSDMALFSASYLRVKNITIGYTFPQQLLSRYKISKLRVFASGDNLFFLSAAKGVDPSMSLTGGMEVGAYTYPTRQTISFGVNIDL